METIGTTSRGNNSVWYSIQVRISVDSVGTKLDSEFYRRISRIRVYFADEWTPRSSQPTLSAAERKSQLIRRVERNWIKRPRITLNNYNALYRIEHSHRPDSRGSVTILIVRLLIRHPAETFNLLSARARLLLLKRLSVYKTVSRT